MSSAAGSQNSAPTSSSEAPTSSPETSTSAQPTSTTNAPTTSNTPATSNTAAASPQSSPAEQSASAAAGITAASSASASSATAAATTTTSSFTSQVATTLFSTDAAGSVVYVTTSVPEVITTSISSSTTASSSNSHTGVIVGAAVGGVAGITILALLFLCIRKRVRKDEFDGNFDPDHVVGRIDRGDGTLPQVNLAEEVTPFPQSYTDQGSSSMRQYGESSYIGVPSSLAASGQTSQELYPSVDAQSRQFLQHGLPPAGAYVSPVNMYGSTGEWNSPRSAASPPPSTSSYNTSSTRGAKEREALGRGGQGQTLGLATQPETAEGGADVVVHRDGGRAPVEDHSPPKEIPPAYDSIPQD